MTITASSEGAEQNPGPHVIARLVKFANVFGIGLITYFLVGLISALAEWGVFAASLAAMSPLLAACTGFAVATGVNWFLSRRFAFKSRRGYFHELALVVLSSAAVFVWNLLVFLGLYYLLAVPLMIAKMAGTLVGFFANYVLRQFWVFSKTPRHRPMSVILQEWTDENRKS